MISILKQLEELPAQKSLFGQEGIIGAISQEHEGRYHNECLLPKVEEISYSRCHLEEIENSSVSKLDHSKNMQVCYHIKAMLHSAQLSSGGT